MTVIFSDSMIDTVGVVLHNHVPTVKGSAWRKSSATGESTPNFRSDGSGFYPTAKGTMLASGLPLSAEYDVECDFIIIDGYGNAGLVGRASATSRTYYHAYYQDGSWNLILWLNGLATNLWTLALPMSAGTYRVKLQLRNAAKKLFVDDGGGYDELFSSTNNSITAKGQGGLRSAFQYADNEGKQFKDFVITDTTTVTTRRRLFVL